MPADGLDSVYYSLQSPQGLVSSRVLSKSGKLHQLEVTVPVGSTATVFLPAEAKVLKESGRQLKAGKAGILSVALPQNGFIKVEVSQGTYRFTAE